ncbi:MAG: hypothetical protein MCM46_05760 [Candidatus Manganitrophus sp. SB1]|nr:hypothetical protein [Candidatus Manganitrophus morganii]
MSRPLRIEFPGAYYHLMNRGLSRQEIFTDRYDREASVKLEGREAMKELWDQIKSKDTWERIRWFNRLKSWEEAPPSTKVTRQDLIAVTIIVVICAFVLLIGIPIAMAIAKLFSK